MFWRFFVYDPPTKPLSPLQDQTLKADSLFQQGKINEAKKSYDKAIGLADTDAFKSDVIQQKAISCATYGDKECASNSREQFKKYNSSKYKIALLNATIFEISGQTDQAKIEYRKIITILDNKKSLSEQEKLVMQNAKSYLGSDDEK